MNVKAIEENCYEISVNTEDRDEALEEVSELIQSKNVSPISSQISFVSDFKEIPSDVAEEIMTKIINNIANETNDEIECIKRLITLGFSGEVLWYHFGFNRLTVSNTLKEIGIDE